MADRYVSPTGADNNPGTNWNVAFLTIQKGIDDCFATGGGNVHVAHGYYAERVKGKTGVNLLGYGPLPAAPPIEAPELDGEAALCPGKPIIDGNQGGTVVALANVQNVKVENFNIIRGKADQNNLGGGIYIRGTQIHIKSNCILVNTADRDGGGSCVDAGSSAILFEDNVFWLNVAQGGGGGVAIIESKDVRFTNGDTFIDNQNTSAGNVGGGGIHIRESKDIVIDQAAFTANVSSYGGGGIFAIDCSGGTPAVTVSNSRFSGNESAHRGGGAGIMRHSWVTFSECEFVANTATIDGGGIAFNNLGGTAAGQDSPAGHRANNTYGLMENCSFENNESGDDGGAVYVSSSSLGIVRTCSFVQNTSENNGGAIQCTYASALDVTDSTFRYNTSRQANGGAISLRNADLLISGATVFQNNIARRGSGGAIFARTADIGFAFTRFLISWGYVARGGVTVAITGASFQNNFSQHAGGAIGVEASHYTLGLSVSTSSFTSNFVRQNGPGGGVYIRGGSATLVDNDFERNQVFMPGPNARGGGVAGINCQGFSMTGGTVAHNRANFGGGVSLLNCANPTLTGVTFNLNFITLPTGSGEDIHTETCAGVTANGLLNANQGSIPGRVTVLP